MSQFGLIVAVAVLIGLAYIQLLRKFDIYEKEPFKILFASFAAGGVVSIIVTTILYSFVSVEHTFAQAFYKVGLIEELAKLITFFLIFKVFRRHFDEIVDGVLYMSCIALGFAVIENVFYAMGSETPFTILALRTFTSTIGHMAFSGIMVVALFVHFRVQRNVGGIILSLLVAAFAHGIYDGVLFEPAYSWSFFGVYWFVVLGAVWVIRLVMSFSRHKKPFTSAIFKSTSQAGNLHCVSCGEKQQSDLLLFWKIESQACGNCGQMDFDWEAWKQMNRYYLPLRKWKKQTKGYRNSGEAVIRFGAYDEHILNVSNQRVSCKPETLGIWLVSENQKDRQQFLRKPILGWILKGVGIQYVMK